MLHLYRKHIKNYDLTQSDSVVRSQPTYVALTLQGTNSTTVCRVVEILSKHGLGYGESGVFHGLNRLNIQLLPE